MIDFNDLIGTPYTEQHNCAWLCAIVTHRLGTHFPEVSAPATNEQRAELFQACIARYGIRIRDAQPGCIAIFRFPPDEDNPDERWHCNVILDNGRMIATRKSLGVHIVRMDPADPRWLVWRLHLQGYYRVDLNKPQEVRT